MNYFHYKPVCILTSLSEYLKLPGLIKLIKLFDKTDITGNLPHIQYYNLVMVTALYFTALYCTGLFVHRTECTHCTVMYWNYDTLYYTVLLISIL